MAHENPLWGTPRIHGELLKLGVQVAQATVAKAIADRQAAGAGLRGYLARSPHTTVFGPSSPLPLTPMSPSPQTTD
jgi:hypothetical protein